VIKLLDCAFKPARKVELCKELLVSVSKDLPATNNPILINTLFDLARTIHDSVDAMTAEGERRHIGALIVSGLIMKVDFRRDLEQQLNIFNDCRGAFFNLQVVIDRLVLRVASLAMKAHRLTKGRHTRKTSGFVKACLAYCHVTIPSVDDLFRRLELMLLCAQVALVNQCLPQTDTFLKAAISLVPEMPHTVTVAKAGTSDEAGFSVFGGGCVDQSIKQSVHQSFT
jgi:hypothetical protein